MEDQNILVFFPATSICRSLGKSRASIRLNRIRAFIFAIDSNAINQFIAIEPCIDLPETTLILASDYAAIQNARAICVRLRKNVANPNARSS